MKKINGFEYRSITSPDETTGAFERFFRLHDERWVKEGGSELSGHPTLVGFQRALVPELSRIGLIRFDELWAEGECRASIYGLDDGNTFYNYNSGFDPAYSRLSVGRIMLGLSIKNAVERGNTMYDFLRGNETYKSDWANQSTNLVNVSLARKTLPVTAYMGMGKCLTGLRDASKAVLPSGIIGVIGTWRRAWKRNYLTGR